MGGCGCKKEVDDRQETNLGMQKISITEQIKPNDDYEVFEEKLALLGEFYNTPIEELLPANIKQLREQNPFKPGQLIDGSHLHYMDEVKLKNGLIYKGGWNSQIQMEGRGMMILINEQIFFDGIWKEGSFIYGQIFFIDGSFYEGEAIGGNLNGKGRFVINPNEYYDGYFVNGSKEGQGFYLFPDQSTYLGDFKQDTITGKGTMAWKNETCYKGDFGCGSFEGEGELAFPNKSKYIGQFKNNLFDGYGEFIWCNGVQYIGQYERGIKQGKGIYLMNNLELQGSWSNGFLQGKITIILNGKTYITFWRSGKLIEVDDQDGDQLMDYLNSIVIQNEDFNLSDYPYLPKSLNESRIYSFRPTQLSNLRETANLNFNK